MANRLETYRAITQILDSTIPAAVLEPLLKSPQFDWDKLVVEGSRHLMLPALYCSLKTKNLLQCPPEELVTYLEELTAINRNRNKAILKQVKALSELLNSHKITHVFLKGAAILVTDLYDDPGARMIGDIDILIAEEQLQSAFELLQQQGYYPIETTFGSDYIAHKHLPRLKTDIDIAAVELHRKVFMNYLFEPLDSGNILKEHIIVNTIAVPSSQCLLWHCILNQQINDDAYTLKSIHFKTGYEVHLLHQKKGLDMSVNSNHNKVLKAYGSFHQFYFANDHLGQDRLSQWQQWHYKQRLCYRFYGRLYYRLAYSWSYFLELTTRIKFFLLKKDYRRSLWKDRKRIWYTLKQRFIYNRPPH